MANKVITIVVETIEQSLDSVLAAAIDEVHKLGHSVRQIRVTDDSGETAIPVNTVPGVTVPEPVSQVTVPAEPTPEEPPAEPAPAEPPTDTPVDPTTPADTSSSVA